MPDLRTTTGSRGATRGVFQKPGFFYPSPDDPVNDYGLVERKTVDSKEQPVAYLTAHPTISALKLCKQDYTDDENGKKTRTRIYRTLPGKLTTRLLFDDDLNVAVAIDTQDLQIGASAPTVSLLLQYEDSPPNEMGWITRQIIRLAALPATKTEYKTEMFTFPALLRSVTGSTKSVGKGKVETAIDTFSYQTGINSFYTITPDIRPAINAPSPLRVVTQFFESKTGTATGIASTDVVTFSSDITPANGACVVFSSITGGTGLAANQVYFMRDSSGQTCKLALTSGGTAVDFSSDITAATSYTTPAQDALYEILPNNPRYSGRLFDFNFGEVLNDEETLSTSAGDYDHALYGLTESVTIAASVPTATEYQADIGEEKLIASDVARYRGNIWTKQNTYVTLR